MRNDGLMATGKYRPGKSRWRPLRLKPLLINYFGSTRQPGYCCEAAAACAAWPAASVLIHISTEAV